MQPVRLHGVSRYNAAASCSTTEPPLEEASEGVLIVVGRSPISIPKAVKRWNRDRRSPFIPEYPLKKGVEGINSPENSAILAKIYHRKQK